MTADDESPQHPDTPGATPGAGGVPARHALGRAARRTRRRRRSAPRAVASRAGRWRRQRTAVDTTTVDLHRSYPFYGPGHQGGIATPPQRHSVFMTFRLADTATRTSLQTLLARWSAAAAVLQQGKPVGSVQPDVEVPPPTDTGEAFGLSPASLTVTIGLGPSLFDDRFGWHRASPRCSRRCRRSTATPWTPSSPAATCPCRPAPTTPRSAITPCETWPASGRSIVAPYWAVLGFGRASAGPGQQTPRNLLGFKDGTRNVATDEQYCEFVWMQNERPAVDGRRHLSGGAQDPDAAGDVGHRPDRQSAADHRAAQAGRVTADRHRRDRHPGLRREGRRGRAGDRPAVPCGACRAARTTAA